MARQYKKGIQYFSMDTDIYADRKIRRIQSKCGPLAMSVILKLLCHIYGEEGYFALADDDFVFDVADELSVDTDLVRGVVAACVDGGFFDKAMHQQHGILTSARVQRNYIAATRKRKHNKDIDAKYRLQFGDDESEPDAPNAVSDASNTVSDAPNAVSDVQSTQSKVNQTKSNKSKAKETKPNQGGADAREVGPLVRMTDAQYSDLVARYGQNGTDCMVQKLGNYKAQSGKEYRSDYHAILGWVVRRYNEEQAQAARSQAMRETFERGTENYDHLAEDLFADDG